MLLYAVSRAEERGIQNEDEERKDATAKREAKKSRAQRQPTRERIPKNEGEKATEGTGTSRPNEKRGRKRKRRQLVIQRHNAAAALTDRSTDEGNTGGDLHGRRQGRSALAHKQNAERPEDRRS